MTTLQELQAKIDELTKQKNELLESQKAEIIERMKKEIQDFNITAEELGFKYGKNEDLSKSGQQEAKHRKPAKIKYLDSKTGNSWTGRGIKPKWVQEYISKNSFETFQKDCLVKEEQPETTK